MSETYINNKASVLILGCGLLQKPAFIAAKELGLKIFSVDRDNTALCVPLSDEFSPVDLKDREGIYEYAKKLKETQNLKGIFTAGTDFSASVSYAAEKLGFHAHTFSAAMNSSDKSLMRTCFKNNRVSSPDFYYVNEGGNEGGDKAGASGGKGSSSIEAIALAKKIGFPCVVKPCDNMGARGCRLVRDEDESESAIQSAFENSRSRTIMIEEYMEGPEFSIDAVVYKNTLTITGFADRHIYYPPYFIETGHTMPSKIDESRKIELIRCFSKGIKALGLTEGVAKADIKYTKKGAQIGEIAARLSGGYMSGWTFPYSSDFFLTKEALKIAVGMEPDELLSKRVKLDIEDSPFEIYEIPSVKVSAERAWISIPGKIKEIIELPVDLPVEKSCVASGATNCSGGAAVSADAASSCVKDVFPRGFTEGSEVDFPRNNVQKCGNVISVSADYEKAVKAAEKKAASFVYRLQAPNQKTEAFLKGIEEKSERGFPPCAYSAYTEIKEKLEGEADFEIKKNASPLENAPDYVKEALILPETGFNYLTAAEEIAAFDKIATVHPVMSGKKFWTSFFRGGLQGALYIADISDSEKNCKE